MSEIPKVISLHNSPIETYLLAISFSYVLDAMRGMLNMPAFFSIQQAIAELEKNPEQFNNFIERISKTFDTVKPECEKVFGQMVSETKTNNGIF
jgi:hypothetical protein